MFTKAELQVNIIGLWVKYPSSESSMINTNSFLKNISSQVTGIIILAERNGSYQLPASSFNINGFSFDLSIVINNRIYIDSSDISAIVIGKAKLPAANLNNRIFTASYESIDGYTGAIQLNWNVDSPNRVTWSNPNSESPIMLSVESLAIENIKGLNDDEYIGIWYANGEVFDEIVSPGTDILDPFATYGIKGGIISPSVVKFNFNTNGASSPIATIIVGLDETIIIPTPLPIGNTVLLEYWESDEGTRYEFGSTASFSDSQVINLTLKYRTVANFIGNIKVGGNYD